MSHQATARALQAGVVTNVMTVRLKLSHNYYNAVIYRCFQIPNPPPTDVFFMYVGVIQEGRTYGK